MGPEATGHVERVDKIRLAIDRKRDGTVVAGKHGQGKIQLFRAMARERDEAVGDDPSTESEDDPLAFHARVPFAIRPSMPPVLKAFA
ncbi:hypothetical protein [Roseibium sp.]|uniref:hypothetical protein n=1 Tax=Roseibium sp. TaxID=1936156 RepID=UPI003A97E58B